MNSLQFNILEDNENDLSFLNYSPSDFQISKNPFTQKLFTEESDIPISSVANNDYESLINCTKSKSNSFDGFREKQPNFERPFFKTEKNNEIIKKENEKKLLMNRLNAKKSRRKKKIYIKKLEEESANLKNQICLNNVDNLSDGANKNFFNHLRLIEQQENEIREKGQKKSIDIMKQYELLEKTILIKMLVKQINLFIPLRFRIYGERNFKLIKFNKDDSLSVLNTKIDENIIKINNYMEIVSKERIKSAIKLKEIFYNLKKYIEVFQLMISTNF